MNVQLPLSENANSKVLKLAPRIKENLSSLFDVRKFVDNFEVLAMVEGGIKKLRELTLVLAVRGCLVPQLAAEGTADALVADLAARRSKLSSAARVRAELASVAPDEQPFSIPPSWRWGRLGHFGGFLGGGTPSKSNTSFWKGPIPWVSPKDMKKPYIDDAEDHISELAVEGSAVKLIPNRSILFVVRGMILAHSFPVAMNTKPVTINQDMKALVLAMPDTREYLLRACWAARSRVLQRVERSSHGTCRLESEVIEKLPIPIPPLAEQKRIVAKVDELMRMLDDLEAKQTKKRETQVRLRSAALGALTSAEGPEEFDAAWQRVSENFEVLFEKADSVADLRRATIDIAIRGLLTSQSPSDGTAIGAVSRMCQQSGGSSQLNEEPFPLPASWAWSRLGAVSSEVRYGYTASARPEQNGVRLLRITDIQNDRVNWDTVPGCEIDDDTLPVFQLRDGDLVVARTGGTIGKTYLVAGLRVHSVFASYLIRIAPLNEMSPQYLKIFTGSGLYWKQLYAGAAGTGQPNVNATTLKTIAIPVPPLKEQDRIVAKVEQLMKLCDDLAAKLQGSETTASKLVEAVVAEMVA